MSLTYLQTDDPTAITRIKDTPVLVDFFSNSCQPCHLMHLELEAYAEHHPGIRVVCVSADIHPKTTAFFRVRLLPTLLLLQDGKKLDIAIGAKTEEMLDSFVTKVLEVHGLSEK